MSLSDRSPSKGNLSKESASNERPDADGEPSAYAPTWARVAYGAGGSLGASHDVLRKVVPLRMLGAPVPLETPAPAPASPSAPAHPAGRRPTGPELLAEDEVLKRLLQRNPPDPQPLVARPTRDPVGLALGMVARLMVAGCAAAVAALLLLGVIPLPFRLGATSETSAPVASSPAPMTMTVAAAPPAAEPQPATPIATVTVHTAGVVPQAAAASAAPAMATDRGALDAGEIDRLVKRGEDYLAQGDIAAARLILGRAAAAHDPRAALSLGATYDPTVLRQLHVVGFRPDVVQARAWYEKAAGYGSHDAAARLMALPRTDP